MSQTGVKFSVMSENSKSYISDKEAVSQLVNAVRSLVNRKQNRLEFADFIHRMLHIPTEELLDNSTIFSEFMFAKLVLECTILDSDEDQLRICSPELGRHLKDLSYQTFSRRYFNELKQNTPTGQKINVTYDDILRHLANYEKILKEEGLSYFGSLFAKRIFQALKVSRKRFKPSHGTMLAMILSTHGLGMYWSSLFSTHVVEIENASEV